MKSWEKNREPDTEFGSTQSEINSIVNYLYESSIIIRSSAPPRDLLKKAAEVDLSHLKTWDVSHVRQMFPEGKSGLVERLGKANIRRRQLFRYLQNHHAKLSKSHGNDHRNGPDGLLVEEDQDSPSTPKVAQEKQRPAPHLSAPLQSPRTHKPPWKLSTTTPRPNYWWTTLLRKRPRLGLMAREWRAVYTSGATSKWL